MEFNGGNLSNGGTGCTICVAEGKTLTLTGVREKLCVYVANGATLILGDVTFASGMQLYMANGSTVSAGNITIQALLLTTKTSS